MLEVAALRIENCNNFRWIMPDAQHASLRSVCVVGSAERLEKHGQVYAAQQGEVDLALARLY